jgi:hypothetical protein
MVMKSIPIILLSVSFSFCSTLIYDFAPTETGSKWVYSYYYSYYWVSYLIQKDSLIVTIELASKKVKGNDTLLFLSIREQGRSVNTGYEGGPIFDTTSDEEFVDTVYISPTTITKAPGYRCKVFPFWNSHGILIDSLTRGMSDANILYVLSIPQQILPIVYTYLQGIGLYKYFNGLFTNHNQSTAINLISFNDKTIPLSIINRSGNRMQRSLPSGNCFKVIIAKHMSDFMGVSYLLNGKKAQPRCIVPGSVYLQRINDGEQQ